MQTRDEISVGNISQMIFDDIFQFFVEKKKDFFIPATLCSPDSSNRIYYIIQRRSNFRFVSSSLFQFPARKCNRGFRPSPQR